MVAHAPTPPRFLSEARRFFYHDTGLELGAVRLLGLVECFKRRFERQHD